MPILPNEQQAVIHAERAERLIEEGRYKDGIAELRLAISHDARNSKGWLLLGELYAMAGHHEPAASYLQKAVREDFSNMRGWVMLANNYCQIGGVYLELALEQIEAAMNIDGEVADLHYLKGNALAQLGDQKSAKACFEKAIQLQPGHPYATRDLQTMTA
jgi:tetratricopeptide (TPR) repeat protein